MSIEFHQTGMGHRFYEGTMPALVEQLKRLNDNLEKLLTQPPENHIFQWWLHNHFKSE
jgi:hypothetical protein